MNWGADSRCLKKMYGSKGLERRFGKIGKKNGYLSVTIQHKKLSTKRLSCPSALVGHPWLSNENSSGFPITTSGMSENSLYLIVTFIHSWTIVATVSHITPNLRTLPVNSFQQSIY